MQYTSTNDDKKNVVKGNSNNLFFCLNISFEFNVILKTRYDNILDEPAFWSNMMKKHKKDVVAVQ